MGHAGRVPSEPAPAELSLREVLGGREAAVDASVPVAAFVVAWALADGLDAARPVLWGTGAALATGVVVAVNRLARGRPPRAVLLGLLGVTVAALVALRTGRAVDFFLLQLVGNAASALVWAVSIAVRWPLLGWSSAWRWGNAPGGGATPTSCADTSGRAGCGSASTSCGCWCSSRCGRTARWSRWAPPASS